MSARIKTNVIKGKKEKGGHQIGQEEELDMKEKAKFIAFLICIPLSKYWHQMGGGK